MPWRASRGLGTVPRWAGVGHLDRGMPCRAGEVSDTLRESDTVGTTCLAGKVPESLTAKVSDTLRESGTVATACLAGKVPESLTAKGVRHHRWDDQFLDLSTSLLAAIQGIMARSLEPTCSIWDSALMRRRDVSVGAPAAFSRMNFLAYSPVWMATRASRMAWRVCSVTILGPVSYSPNSALFEIE